MSCCSRNNSQIPGQPEYGKGYKSANNAGCGCSCNNCTTTTSSSTTTTSSSSSSSNCSVRLRSRNSVTKVSAANYGSSLSTPKSSSLLSYNNRSQLSAANCSSKLSVGSNSNLGCTSTVTSCDTRCDTTESIGPGQCVERVKIVLGGDGVDGGNVTADNPLPVTPFPGEQIIIYDSVTLVPSSSETTVVTYTVPSSKQFNLTGFMASANADAVYRIYIDGVLKASVRSTVANLNVNTDFAHMSLIVDSATVVSLKIYHEYTGLTPDAEGSLLGWLK